MAPCQTSPSNRYEISQFVSKMSKYKFSKQPEHLAVSMQSKLNRKPKPGDNFTSLFNHWGRVSPLASIGPSSLHSPFMDTFLARVLRNCSRSWRKLWKISIC
jgi:hypothetical protein